MITTTLVRHVSVLQDCTTFVTSQNLTECSPWGRNGLGMVRKKRHAHDAGCRPRAWKISEQTLFSEQAQVAQKSWMVKNTYSMQWKNPEQLCFSGQAQVAQQSWMYEVNNFRATLFFSEQVPVAQNSWIIKNIFNTVKNFCGNSVFRTSASC